MPKGVYIRTEKHKKNLHLRLGKYSEKGFYEKRDFSGFKIRKVGEFRQTEEAKRKISLANTKNSRHYSSLHSWVTRYKGKAFGCIDCGTTEKDKNYEWSNVSGEYLRDLSDYVSRCVPCHRKKDGNNKIYLFSPLYKKYTERKKGK